MEYHEVRQIAQEASWKFMKEFFDTKDCPVCKSSTTMLKVEVQSLEEDLEEELSLPDVKWRCMNCMNLFTEKLEKV